MSVPAPVDDVVAVGCPDSLLKCRERDAVTEDVNLDVVTRQDVLVEQVEQSFPFLPHCQRVRTGCFGKHQQHAQCLASGYPRGNGCYCFITLGGVFRDQSHH